MSDLVPNAFIGRAERPTDADLAGALGATKPLWDGLIADMADRHGVAVQEWKCSSPKTGWALLLKRAKRTILWMAPCQGSFRVSLILGGRAVLAARQSGPSARLLKIIDQAPKYPEGTGLRLQIKGPRDMAAVRKLAVAKLEN
jgi:hypothetical protein